MGKILRYKENIKQGETVVCYCDVCKIKTKHVVVVDHQEYEDTFYEAAKETYDGESWIRDYQIIKCNNCDELSFRIDGCFSEAISCTSSKRGLEYFTQRRECGCA